MSGQIEPVVRISRVPRFRLAWGAKDAVRGTWRFGLVGFHVKGYPRELWIVISVRGLLLWSSAMAVGAFLLGTAVAAVLLSRNPYNRIGYWDLVLPNRWRELRTKRGLGYIDEGLADIRASDFAPGIMLLNHGSALAPTDLRARLTLGEIYAVTGYPRRAMQLYRAELTYSGNKRPYLEIALRLARYLEDYEAALEIVREAETRLASADESLRTWLAEQKIEALAKLERHAEIVRLWEARKDAPLPVLDLAWARSVAALGQGDLALTFMAANPQRFGSPPQRWEAVLAVAQSLQRNEVARDALRHLIALDPSLPRYYIEEIDALAKAGETAEAGRLLHDFFLRFGYNANGPLALMRRLAEAPVEPVLTAAWQETTASGLALPAIRAWYMQGLILLGRVTEAQQEFDRARLDMMKKATGPAAGWLVGTQALFDLLREDTSTTRANLFTFCTRSPQDPGTFRFLFQALARNGRGESANEIIVIAKNRFTAMTGLTPVAIERPPVEVAAPEVKPAVTVAPTPPPENDPAERAEPLSPEALAVELGKIDADLQASKWDEAGRRLDALGDVRDDKITPGLLFRRLRVYGARSELVEIKSALQRLLFTRPPSLSDLRDLALKLYQEGKVDSALVIVQTIARNRPDAIWAENLGREWSQSLKITSPESPEKNPLRESGAN